MVRRRELPAVPGPAERPHDALDRTTPACRSIARRRRTATARRATAKDASSPAATAIAACTASSSTARVTTLVDRHAGKRLNAPNDVVVKSDGSIWFTDPLYGISNDYEGGIQASEQPPAVYRFDPSTGAIDAVATDFDGPNGLAFSPDESRLYIAETGDQTRRRPGAGAARVRRRARRPLARERPRLPPDRPRLLRRAEGRRRRQRLVERGRRRPLHRSRTAGCSARSSCRTAWRTSRSVARRRTGSSSPRRTRCTRST